MYNLCRVLGLLIGVPYNIGTLIFLKPEYGAFKIVFISSAGIALVIGALVSEKYLKIYFFNKFILLLFFLAIINCSYDIFLDITLVNGPDYPALLLRLIAFFVLLAFIWRSIQIEMK